MHSCCTDAILIMDAGAHDSPVAWAYVPAACGRG